jgi:hypothetical protein
MLAICATWPSLDESIDRVRWAINDAMNNLLGYPHHHHDDWDSQFPFSRRELIETFAAWRGK